jgi:ribonuclease H2 subunit A
VQRHPDSLGFGVVKDPRTQAWLENNVDPIFGLPSVVRFSWQTVKTLLDKRAHKVKWADEPSTIQRYFHPLAQDAGRPTLFKDLSLVSVGDV